MLLLAVMINKITKWSAENAAKLLKQYNTVSAIPKRSTPEKPTAKF